MFSEMTGVPVDAVAMRAWRFWASFLGFGYFTRNVRNSNANVFGRCDQFHESRKEKNVFGK